MTTIYESSQAGFPLFTAETAPAESRETLEAVKKMFGGYLPNLFRVSALSPELLSGQAALKNLTSATSLTNLEAQVIDLAVSRINGCAYCTAAHTFNSRHLDQAVISAAISGAPISDPKIDAVRNLAVELVENRGRVSEETRRAFHEAGNTDKQALEIILVVGLKQIQNHINEFAATPIDEAFA